MTPTARTLKRLRDQGMMAAVVERWNPYAKIRQDLFGFLDVVAVEPGTQGVLGIQATSGTNVAHRLAKLREEPIASRVEVWLAAGNRLAVIGWRKVGPRGKRKTWKARTEMVTA